MQSEDEAGLGFVVSIVTSKVPQIANSSSSGLLTCAYCGTWYARGFSSVFLFQFVFSSPCVLRLQRGFLSNFMPLSQQYSAVTRYLELCLLCGWWWEGEILAFPGPISVLGRFYTPGAQGEDSSSGAPFWAPPSYLLECLLETRTA